MTAALSTASCVHGTPRQARSRQACTRLDDKDELAVVVAGGRQGRTLIASTVLPFRLRSHSTRVRAGPESAERGNALCSLVQVEPERVSPGLELIHDARHDLLNAPLVYQQHPTSVMDELRGGTGSGSGAQLIMTWRCSGSTARPASGW